MIGFIGLKMVTNLANNSMLGCNTEMNIDQKGDNVCFSWVSPDDGDGHCDVKAIDINVKDYRWAVERLLKTGNCNLGSTKLRREKRI